MFYSLLGRLTVQHRVLYLSASSSSPTNDRQSVTSGNCEGVSLLRHFLGSFISWTLAVCGGAHPPSRILSLYSSSKCSFTYHRHSWFGPYCANSSIFSRKSIPSLPKFPFPSGYVILWYDYDIVLFQWSFFLGPLLRTVKLETKNDFEVAAGT